jgi:hypothetical protein
MKWHGKWFIPVVGERYMVPPDSANYSDRHGQAGVCTDVRATEFGHSWAMLDWGDGTSSPVRTMYLVPADESR